MFIWIPDVGNEGNVKNVNHTVCTVPAWELLSGLYILVERKDISIHRRIKLINQSWHQYSGRLQLKRQSIAYFQSLRIVSKSGAITIIKAKPKVICDIACTCRGVNWHLWVGDSGLSGPHDTTGTTGKYKYRTTGMNRLFTPVCYSGMQHPALCPMQFTS